MNRKEQRKKRKQEEKAGKKGSNPYFVNNSAWVYPEHKEDKMPVPGSEEKVLYIIGKDLSDGNGGMQSGIQVMAEALAEKGVKITCRRNPYADGRDLLTIVGPAEFVKGLQSFASSQVKA
jgi:hypothetical protein